MQFILIKSDGEINNFVTDTSRKVPGGDEIRKRMSNGGKKN